MNLKENILRIVQLNKGIKAKEIANQLNVDKSQVNSVLYGQLQGRVYQDNQYRWHAGKQTGEEDPGILSVELNTPLARLSKYYLDCLSRDIDTEVSVFASSKYGCPEYGQLSSLPFYKSREDSYEPECVRKTINKVLKEKNRLNLVLGYPLYLNEFTARNGNTYQKIEPLFLFKHDQESISYNGIPSLSDDLPQLNSAAFKNMTGASGHEILNEMLVLYEELGLEGNEELPDWDDLFVRLQSVREEWPWMEKLNPAELSDTEMAHIDQPGIYNTAGIFPSERSRYTVGLERELNDFIVKTEEECRGSALENWINKDLKNKNSTSYHLIEPLPLNEEQRQAVEKALSEPLTVVTGPPGTGKSQVVTNILVNSVYNGQKVLFASKNHKAVDVVNDRVNGLSSRPMVLRLGKAEARAEIASYLSGLLSSTVSQSEVNRFDELKQVDERLQSKLNIMQSRQKEIIECRNDTDKLEQEVEEYRAHFGEEVFTNIRSWTNNEVAAYKSNIKETESTIQFADKSKQPLFTRLFWILHRKKRFANLKDYYKKLRSLSENLGMLFESFNYDNIPDERILLEGHRNKLKVLQEDLHKAEVIHQYFQYLNRLKELPDLFDLSQQSKEIREKIYENSQELWDYWSKLLPQRLTQYERSIISDYAVLLKMIVKANEQGTEVERKVWAQYYRILPKVSGILSAWAITSLSVRGRVPSEPGFFDLVVIDEASQCDIASALPLLFRAKRAVIIGDPQQLRHITMVNEKEDQQLMDRYDLMKSFLSWSYSESSLFDLAASISGVNNVINLKDHHRSHADIIEFSNKHFYDGSLRIATKYEHLRFLPNEPAVNWKHVSGKAERHPQGGSVNRQEAQAVIQELIRIIGNGYKGSVGVVTPFRQQANLIREMAFKNRQVSEQLLIREFLADTVHKFQGDERDVMIFSPAYSNGIHKGSEIFLKNSGNLFNVAITRARASLLIVGDKMACQKSKVDYLSKFATYVDTMENDKVPDHIMKDFGAEFPSQYDSPKVSDWEKYFYKKLYQAGIRTMPQFQVGQYRLDLAIINGDRKLDIEIDGEKYHRNWDGDLVWRDQLRNMRLIEQGWDVKRFWVYEIRDDLDRCISEIKNWIEN